MNKSSYEYIVLGCGGIGSGAAYWLARRAGSEVLGLEQFALSHPYGGSQDHSRIIRLTYHHADYTRLTPQSYAAWAVLEKESAVPVITERAASSWRSSTARISETSRRTRRRWMRPAFRTSASMATRSCGAGPSFAWTRRSTR